jgi:hypothetical protein
MEIAVFHPCYFFGAGFCGVGCCAGGFPVGWLVGATGSFTGGCVAGFAGAGADCCVSSRIDPVVDVSAGPRFTESVSEVIMNTIAHHVVARERNVAAPLGPNAVWLPAPPNAPARSAAFPLCSMITITNTKHASICSVMSSAETCQPIQTSPTPTASETAHFAHDGISGS